MTRAARTEALAPSALFLAFAALYAGVGIALQRSAPMAFAYLDQIFDADVPSRVIDLTRFAGPHHRTQYHPLFVLLLNPVGVALKALLRVFEVEQAGRLAAALLCALAGAACVAAFSRLLRQSGLDLATTLLWSAVFALSASQLFFSVVPESWVFSALALLLLFGSASRRPLARVAAGVFAFGMAVTNVVAVVLAAAGSRDADVRPPLRAQATYVVIVVAIVAALSVVQTAIYAETAPFWSVSGLPRDDRLSFVWPGHPRDVVARVAELVPNFLEWNLAAPRVTTKRDEARTVVDFAPEGALPRPAGIVHAAIWAAVVLAALARGVRTRAWRRPLVAVLGLWTLALAALHMVFGTSLFLYSGQWTFAVVGLVALSGEGWDGRSLVVLRAALVALALLQLATNGALLLEIARAFPNPWAP
jgi:hypothetical protein